MILEPYPVQSKRQRLERSLPFRRFQLTLPYADRVPAHLRQSALLLLVPLFVPSDFLHPELAVRLRNLTALRTLHYPRVHMMSVPEAAVHEYARSVFPQHQVRMSWQPFVVQPVSESPLPQPPPHNPFRLRVLGTNRRHVLMDLFCG